MRKTFIMSALCAAAALAAGCDKQTKINTAKIDALSQKVVLLQQIQAKQLADIQVQLAALTPTLDKMSDTYFEKSHQDAIFFHTNTLYLLLMVDRKIESELQTAAAAQQAEHDLAYSYHTNQVDTLYRIAALIKEDMTAQENQLATNVNDETSRLVAALRDDLAERIKSSAPDAAEIARRQQLAADVAQMKNDLAQIKARLTNSSPAQP